MAYTAYKFKPSFVEKRLKSYKSNLMKFKGHDNLVANAVRVIRERLEADPSARTGTRDIPLDRGVFHAQVWEWPVPENRVSVPLASFTTSFSSSWAASSPGVHSWAHSAKSARNPRLCEAGRNGGKDSKMRGIRQNRKPHIIK